MNNEIIRFVNGDLQLDVTVSPDNETVWLNRNQIAQLFGRDIKTIGKHINNALKEELSNEVVVAKFATTSQHGAIEGKTQTHMVEYYNLDMIISVGYRVKSKNGIIFRKWATSILKGYMMKGYAINEKRIEVLNKTVSIQSRMLASTLNIEEKEVLSVVEAYSNALTLLDDYDHETIPKPDGIASIYRLTYEECRELIDSMKYGNFSDVFGVEKEEGKLKTDAEQTVIVTLGSRGALVAGSKDMLFVDSYKVPAVDTVGAGDCFAGVFAAKLAEGKDVGESVKTAARAAAVCVTRKGAAPAMPDAGELEHFCSVGCLP